MTDDVSVIDDVLLDLVLDTYTPDGVWIWCNNWMQADDPKRRTMRTSLVSQA